MNKIQPFLERFFGIDCRSLALFRVCIALIVLYDLTVRACDLNMFYTDNGVLPRLAMIGSSLDSWIFSIHLMSGNAYVQGALFVLQGLCALGLLFGYKTRWMTFFTWILLASLQRRNPYVFGGADNYLRMMLFWAMFIPLGARYSIDNCLSRSPLKNHFTVLNCGTAAILLQTVFVYVFTGLHKWPGELWHNGSALYYAFHINLYARDFSQWLLSYPVLLKGITHCILWLELVGPLFLFFPIFTARLRIFTVFLFVLLQLGFASLMHLILFPAISIAALMLYIPACTWDRSITPIAKNMSNRFQFKKWLPCRLFENVISFIGSKTSPSGQPSGPSKLKTHLITNIIAVFFLLFTLLWLLSKLPAPRYNLSKPLRNFGHFMYIDQTWKMFAPGPARMGGWMVASGTLADGSLVDLSRGGLPVNWNEPAKAELIKNERWRKYLVHFVMLKNKKVAAQYAEYLCRSWNQGHSGTKHLGSLEINPMVRVTKPDGKSGEYEKRTLLRHDCR